MSALPLHLMSKPNNTMPLTASKNSTMYRLGCQVGALTTQPVAGIITQAEACQLGGEPVRSRKGGGAMVTYNTLIVMIAFGMFTIALLNNTRK